MWGTKTAELWMELRSEVLQYLSVAMQMDAESSAAQEDTPVESQEAPVESQPDDADGLADADHVEQSVVKRQKRRFQPKRSPKKKHRKAAKLEEATNQESNQSETAEPPSNGS